MGTRAVQAGEVLGDDGTWSRASRLLRLPCPRASESRAKALAWTRVSLAPEARGPDEARVEARVAARAVAIVWVEATVRGAVEAKVEAKAWAGAMASAEARDEASVAATARAALVLSAVKAHAGLALDPLSQMRFELATRRKR